MQSLYNALYEHIRIVFIDLDQQDDAQLIFETLNARGTPLLAADLVKNVLLQEAATAALDAADLYDQHWRAFDEDAAYWRRKVGRGANERSRIDLFLQHYLAMCTQDEVPATHLYTCFKDHVTESPAGPVHHLASLSRFAKIHRNLVQATGNARTRIFLKRLATMDVGTAYPFLLAAFDRLDDGLPRLSAVLDSVEAYLVRRMVCRLNTRGYGRLFIELLRAIDATREDIPQRVYIRLSAGTAEVDRWPSDMECRDAWLSAPLYDVLTRPRLRLLLEALEMAMRSGKLAETQQVPPSLTVEHVMPQSWEEHWPLPTDCPSDEASGRRRRLLHTIGNLTLVSKRLNPSMSNWPWKAADGGRAKRDELAKHSVLHLNKQFDLFEHWTEAAIEKRGQQLFVEAQKIWPGPNIASTSIAA